MKTLRFPTQAPGAAATELDARRELAAEFRIDSLLQRSPGLITYLASDAVDRAVALKVVPREMVSDRDGEARFRHAAEAAAALNHPHLIPVYRCGATPNFLWYTMKHVEGRSLEGIIRDSGPLELPTCLRILEQIGSALDYAHRRGVAHGDLRPGNVIIDANDWALVGDCAIAGSLAASASDSRDPTPSADQYALAALAYECLSGTAPPAELPPKLLEVRPETPPHASEVLGRALSPFPTERFPTALDFVAALGSSSTAPRSAWLRRPARKGLVSPVVIIDFQEEPPRRMSRGAAVAAGFVIALAAGGVWLNLPSAPAAPATRAAPAVAGTIAGAPVRPSPPRDSGPTLQRTPPPRPPPPAPVPSPTRAAPPPARTAPPPPRTTTASGVVAAPPPVERRVEPAHLGVNAIPWGNVVIDGRLVGTTPLADAWISPGVHRLRVEREGFQPYERVIAVAPGQTLRITDIVLRAVTP